MIRKITDTLFKIIFILNNNYCEKENDIVEMLMSCYSTKAHCLTGHKSTTRTHTHAFFIRIHRFTPTEIKFKIHVHTFTIVHHSALAEFSRLCDASSIINRHKTFIIIIIIIKKLTSYLNVHLRINRWRTEDNSTFLHSFMMLFSY